MKQTPNITLLAKDLRPALIGLAKIIPNKSTLPVLGFIQISTGGKPDTITLTGTDLDSYLELKVTAEAPTKFDPFLIPLADLRDALKGCGATDTITLQAEAEDRVTLTRKTGTTCIPRTLTGLPLSEFPELPTLKAEAFELDHTAKEGLLQAMACSSTDVTRFVLNGACIDEGHSIVGTDGRHLYRANSMKLPVKNAAIIPYRKVLDWKPLRDSEDWQLALDENWYQLTGANWKLTGKLIEGTYPNWKQVLPPDKDFKSSATLPEDTLEQLVSTIRSLPGEKIENKPVGLRLSHRGLVLLVRADEGAPHTEIPVEGAKTVGPAATVFVNRDYLTKALTFGLNRVDVIDESSPVRLRQGASTERDMIVMPIRITAPEPASKSASAKTPAKGHESDPEPRQTKPTSTPTMKNNTHSDGGNGRQKPEEPGELTPLESATTYLLNAKGFLRQAVSELTELGNTLKQAKSQQKVTQKEIRQVRSTIRTLQKVEL